MFGLEKTSFLVKSAHFCISFAYYYFYFEDFQWLIFGKMIGQILQIVSPKKIR